MSKFVFSCKVQALEEFILFSLELVMKNYEKRSVEWGGARTGWDEPGSLERIFSVKKDERKMEVRDYLHVDLWSLMAI